MKDRLFHSFHKSISGTLIQLHAKDRSSPHIDFAWSLSRSIIQTIAYPSFPRFAVIVPLRGGSDLGSFC